MKINIEEIIFIILNFFYWVIIEAYQKQLNQYTEEVSKSEVLISSLIISIGVWLLVYKLIIPIYKLIKNKVNKNE